MRSIKFDWSFLRIVAVCFIALSLLAVYPISEFATPNVTHSIVAGAVLSLFNLLMGYLFIELSFEKSHTTFLKYVLGGMVGRLFLMWGILLVLIGVFQFHAASLMLSLLFFYIVNLMLEIFYLQRRVSTKR